MKLRLNFKIFGTLFFTLFFLSGFQQAFAQDEEATTDDEIVCHPERLATPYDAAKNDSIDANQLNILYDYGREYYKKGQYGGKLSNFRKAIPFFWKVVINDRGRHFKIVYSKLVDCYLKTDQVDSALIAIYRGLEVYPNYATLHYHAGQLQKALGKTACAIPHYEALVRAKNQKPEALKNYWAILAKLYQKLDDDRCIAAQQKVIELDPNDVEAASMLAKMMEYFGQDPIKALEQAFLKDTTIVSNARQYGLAAYESGNYQKAIRAFQAVLASDPKNIEAMSYIGRSYESMDRLNDAISIYKKIINIDPNRLNTLCSIAMVYARKNDFPTARSYLHRALRKDVNYGLAYMVMGEIYENAVNDCSNNRKKKGYTYDDKLVFEMARKEYRKAMKRDPNMAAQAQNRFELLEPFVRTQADIHMHSGRNTLKDPCYRWISPKVQ